MTILDALESEGNQEQKQDKFNRVDLKVRNNNKPTQPASISFVSTLLGNDLLIQ